MQRASLHSSAALPVSAAVPCRDVTAVENKLPDVAGEKSDSPMNGLADSLGAADPADDPPVDAVGKEEDALLNNETPAKGLPASLDSPALFGGCTRSDSAGLFMPSVCWPCLSR
mmetsp:Transcript_63756/g.132066  ORF Transcript_63756/g.132066 Transcript_63756/m.132066 type:complete len:114 (-) Transcript_63756:27-368(-)